MSSSTTLACAAGDDTAAQAEPSLLNATSNAGGEPRDDSDSSFARQSLTSSSISPFLRQPEPGSTLLERRPRVLNKKLMGLMVAGHLSAGFDAWTTRRALTHPGSYEANPLIRPFARTGAVYLVTQGDAVMAHFLLRRLRNRKLAVAISVAVTGMHLFLGSRNLAGGN